MKGLVLCVLLCGLCSALAAISLQGLHVSGNKILNGNNQVVTLRGVDRSGTEFACIQGNGIFNGPNNQSSINAILSWNANIVRVPLNEDCWLGINGVLPAYGGTNYQVAIQQFVNLLNSNGIVVILDLHWTAPGNTPATGQLPMPDTDHSITFWQQVAQAYATNSMVIFDLFNEPYPDSNQNTTAAWVCWLKGGTCPGFSYQAAGMQQLVTAVRSQGAKNILMLGGINYSNTLAQWYQYMPVDPLQNLAASWHSYNFNTCSQQTCWDQTIAPLAQKVPIIAGEIGESDCAGGYITPLMNWMDSKGLHYLAWTWNTWDCDTGPALITSYSGAATGFGQAYKAHIAP